MKNAVFILFSIFFLYSCSNIFGKPDITQQCTLSARGIVECTFYNEGNAKGSQCIKPIISRKMHNDNYYYKFAQDNITSITKLCSGIVEPNDVIDRSTTAFFKISSKTIDLDKFCIATYNEEYDFFEGNVLRPGSKFWDGCEWYISEVN